MEARRAKELRVRVRRIKVNSSTCSPTTASVADVTSTSSKTEAIEGMETEIPCTSKSTVMPSNSSSPSTSDGDDFATVHFKLAAALEAAAAHASGSGGGAHLLDWQSMKSALIAEAKPTFKLKSCSDQKSEDVEAEARVSDAELQDCVSTETQLGGVLLKPRHDSDSSSTSSSDEDDDVPEILLVSPEPNADTMDSDRSMLLSKLPFSDPGVSVVDDKNPTAALSKILSLPPFDPHAPHLQVQLIIKNVVSLTQLSQREDNVIEVDIKKSLIAEFAISKKHRTLSPFMDVSNIHVKHSNDEFFTFCSCKNCLKYREIVIHIMVEQFKTAHMVVMLLDVLIKAYGPMLKNRTAYNKFEKLLDANKEIYWIACGFVYNKKAEHMDFIYDDSLSDNMIFVLFSSILMVNNPLLLLQILAFHVECIVKAYAEGFIEIVEPDNNKIPAEEMLTYILDGYDDLCRISEQISCYLFAFENDFLRKFNLSWTLLCQRLYQLHVYSNLTDTMLACIITLKEDELTSRHAALIKKYIQFDDKMTYVEKRWSDVWNELNKFNLSETERKRRKCLLNVHRIFDTVVQDAIAFSLQEFDDDNDFYDFQCLENRRLAWQNIMAYTKMKWPDGFFKPPNTLACDDKCQKCNVLLEYHPENCKCITCSIAGGPLPPRRNPDQACYKCMAQSLIEKEVNLYESKILNVCTSDDFLSFVRSNGKRKSSTLEELGEEVCGTLSAIEGKFDDTTELGQYHIAWAVFQHFNSRKRYKHATIEEKYFCKDCTSPACLLALKILNNEVAHALSLHLVQYYQQLSMSIEELRAILPNIMFYNRKMIAFNIGFDLTDVHDLVVKIYWTFIISLYARYFLEFDLKCPLNLTYFELSNNDVKLCTDKLVGSKDDTKFVKFLDKIKSLSPFKSQVESDFAFTVDVHTEEIQKKLDELLNFEDNQRSPPLSEQIAPPVTNLEPATVVEDHPKKNCKERLKKCCFDHSDLGDHCKENHSTKKRIKKECNHARMNETRDRLRKKLSQLVNARKNMKATASDQQQQLQQQPPAPIAAIPSTSTKQPPSLKAVAKAAAVATAANSKPHSSTGSKLEDDDDSLVCLSTLCKRISHLHMNATASGGQTSQSTTTASTTTPSQNSGSKKATSSTAATGSSGTPPAKKPSNSGANAAAWEAAQREANIGRGTHAKNTSGGSEKGGGGSSRDLSVLSVYLNSYSKEFLDNYSRDQSKVRKWINETLSYIEGGSGGSNGNGKKAQPQTTNPKKAAKKAKQKQRKEEEKRIIELQDLRGQFYDIYFKEFTDKHKLKLLKSSKKRDKKQIGELETNIKKLQRAKAKVETVILELIATVKQTNGEFRFSYLPTKEQQVEKLKAIEENPFSAAIGNGANVPSTSAKAIDGINNLNAASCIAQGKSSYGLPPVYASANVPGVPFSPYQIDFQASQHGAAGPGYGMISTPMPTPMCYAPPPHQTLSPDVVAAMAANAACNSNTDPSKRIVTIRRVNLPNVPEPRVTVTAKGSSPDKDKLLYTFVNGQLVPTTAPPMTQLPLHQLSNVKEPRVTLSAKSNSSDKDKLLYTFVNGQLVPTSAPPMTQLPLQQIPLPLPMQAPPPPPPVTTSDTPADQLSLAIPPPPLSKPQLKKERRRAAKLAAEEAAASQEEQLRQEQEKLNNQKRAGKKAKLKTDEVVKQRDVTAASNSKSKKNSGKNVVTPSASTTSVSTTEPFEGAPKKGGKAATMATQRRSASTTTSCSAGTSLSATPVNSQMNTRENSVSSQKPGAVAGEISKKGKLTTQHPQKTQSQVQKTITAQKKQNEVNKQQQEEPNKGSAGNKKVCELVKMERVTAPSPEPTARVEKEVEQKEQKKLKKERIRYTRPIDNGQFDNNPFATLHTQDSDSDWNSACSSYDEEDDETDTEAVLQTQSQVVIVQQKASAPPPSSKPQATPKTMPSQARKPSSITAATAPAIATSAVLKAKAKIGEQKVKENATANQQNTRQQNKRGQQEQRKDNVISKKQQQQQQQQKQQLPPQTPQKQHQQQQQTSQPKQRAPTLSQRRGDKDREREREHDRESLSSKEKAKGKENVQTTSQNSKNIGLGAGGGRGSAAQSVVSGASQRDVHSKSGRQSSRQQKMTDHGVQKQMQGQLQGQPQDQPRTRGGRGSRGGGGGDGGGVAAGGDSRPKRGGGSRYERGGRGSGGGGGGNQSSNRNSAEPTQQASGSGAEGKPLSKRAQRQAQRNKKFQKQQHLHHNYEDCGAGIPNNMGYFNPDEVVIPSAPQPNLQQQQQRQYNSLPQQLQSLHIGGNVSVKVNGQQPMQPSYASVSNGGNNAGFQGMVPALSIMDQLNRGVQVENLSLPPGITLTKVDPVKSEQLRQKSESIRKLSKPLQQQAPHSSSFHHKAGATIIAPPVAPVGNYFGAAPYAGVAAAAAALEQSGIIMVEANPASNNRKKEHSKMGAGGGSAPPSGKPSKSKKRRNKSKQESNARAAAAAAVATNVNGLISGTIGDSGADQSASGQPKMITLRNPMFHGGAASAAATIIQQQPGLIPGRPLGGLPLAAPLPMDQPAAIIKNENGMFTIRNPALHQAVTNGLALGGYRQFGNVSYYTPQEAAAEAVRATQLQQQQNAASQMISTNNGDGSSTSSSSAFSYFSNASSGNAPGSSASSAGSVGGGTIGNTHNTISISCTSIDEHGGGSTSISGNGGGLTGDAAVIARPSPQPKCISAIGSEIKNAQQQKQKCKEGTAQWPAFVGQELQNSGVPGADNLAAAAYLGTAGNGCVSNTGSSGVGVGASVGSGGGTGGCLTAASLQEKYQQSSYYNGYVDVFPPTAQSTNSQMSTPGALSSHTGSLFDGSTDCHLHHHNCGEDSPPPTITGYNSYLDGITNTGVIRYDDASFLKNLIPGQNLSNEVSIHNINDSNFTRSTTSPVAHRVEITPVYRSRPTSTTTNIYEHCTTSASLTQSALVEQQAQYHSSVVPNYNESLADFGNEASSIFAPNNLVNLNELDAGSAGTESDVESYQRYNYEYESQQQQQQQQQKAILDLNELLIKKSSHSPHAQCASPYLDEAAMDSFVQNISTLQISTTADEQCGGHLNGNGSGGSAGNGSSSAGAGSVPSNSATSTTANGWW